MCNVNSEELKLIYAWIFAIFFFSSLFAQTYSDEEGPPGAEYPKNKIGRFFIKVLDFHLCSSPLIVFGVGFLLLLPIIAPIGFIICLFTDCGSFSWTLYVGGWFWLSLIYTVSRSTIFTFKSAASNPSNEIQINPETESETITPGYFLRLGYDYLGRGSFTREGWPDIELYNEDYHAMLGGNRTSVIRTKGGINAIVLPMAQTGD